MTHPSDAYEDHAITSERDRLSRLAHFILGSLGSFIIPVGLISMFFPPFWWVGIPLGIPIFFFMLPYMIFHVGELQALVSLNRANGKMVPYGPGWHPRLAWEEVHRYSNISLKEVTENFSETFPTMDDSRVKGEFSFGYRPRLSNILRFRAADPSTVKDGFQGFIEATMAGIASSGGYQKLIGHEEEISKRLTEGFEKHKLPADGSTPSETLEDRYGIDVTFIRVNRFELPKEVQEALEAIAEQDAMERIAARVLGFGKNVDAFREAVKNNTIKPYQLKAAYDQALILSGEKVEKKIFSIEGLERLDPETAAVIGGIATGVAAFATSSKGKPTGGKPSGSKKSEPRR